MAILANISAIGAAAMGCALVSMGYTAITNPQKGGSNYGLPTTGTHWVPVWGVRDAGFGAAILLLLAAGRLGVLKAGEWEKAAGIVTLAGAGVGASDAWLLAREGAPGSAGHLAGATAMAAFAIGMWLSA